MLAAHLALLGASAAVLRARARRLPAERHLPLYALGTLVLLPALAGLLDGRIPVAWLTSLREGTSWNHAEVATATSFQQSPGMESFWLEVLPVTRDFGGVVAANLALQATALLLLAPILARVAGPVAAAVLTAALALSPTTHAAMWSETGGPLTQVLLLLAVAPSASLRDDHADRRERRAAAVALLALALALAPVRLELIVFPLAGLVVWPGLDAALSRVGGRPGPALLVGAGFGAACAWLGPVLRVEGSPSPHLDVLLTVLQPGNPTWGALPLELLRHLPVGVVLLVVGGVALSLRTRLALLGPLLLAVGALYRGEAHDVLLFGPHRASGWELVRYAPHLLVPALLLAALAWREAPARLLLPLCLLPPWDHTLLRPVEAGHPRDLPWSGVVDQDQQREVRLIVQQLRDHPDCGVLVRARPWGPTQAPLTWLALRPEDGRFRFIRHRGDPDLPPQAAAEALLPEQRCVVALLSLDCNPGRCPELEELPDLGTHTWASRPFVHPDHGVPWLDEVRVGWRAVVRH